MKVNHKTFTCGYKFDNFEAQPSIHIQSFTPKSVVSDMAIKPFKDMTARDVLKVLGRMGIQGPKSALVPTEGQIEPAMVKKVVVNIVEVEPYDLPNEALLREEHKTRFVDGLKSIHESFNKAKITIVVSDNKQEIIHMVTSIAQNLTWLEIDSIESKYPANFKEIMIPAVFGETYPVGYDSTHLGILVLSVGDVLQVTKTVTENKAADSVVVALSGPGWRDNVLIEVPVGTSVKDITDQYLGKGEIRLIENSVLTGEVIEEGVITFNTKVLIALPEDRRRQTLFFLRPGQSADSFSNAFLSRLLPKAEKTAETNLHGERRACVSCTYCQSVCPVDLIPHLLHKHVDKGIINKRLAEYKIFDCVECDLCDYVCPSKIEISSDIKKGKLLLEENEISHNDYVIPGCDMIFEPKEVAENE